VSRARARTSRRQQKLGLMFARARDTQRVGLFFSLGCLEVVCSYLFCLHCLLRLS
jgi:hypothetical protein